MSNLSLKRRLRCFVVIPILVALLIMSVAAYFSARHEIEEVDDAQLARIAQLIYSLIPEHVQPETMNTIAAEEVFAQLGHRYQRFIAYRVWQGDTLVFSSRNVDAFTKRFEQQGYMDWKEPDGRRWRGFMIKDARGIQIEVGESYRLRSDITTKIMISIFSPLALLLPVVFLIFSFGLQRGLAPLSEVSQAVSRRTARELTPITEAESPAEIKPLVQSINQLMQRIRDAMVREREFTDHAAHELRTPLSVLKLHAQTALRSKCEKERVQVLYDLIDAVDRSTSMVEQLLSLARLEQASPEHQPSNLVALVKESLQQYLPLALQKGQEIELQFSDHADYRVKANADLVHTLLSNLIVNAIKYSPSSSLIQVALVHTEQGIVFSVSDEGPGIPATALQHVTQRFYRVTGTQGQGVGLGLSIVQRICELIQAEMQLQNRTDRSGLLVKIIFISDTPR